MLIIPVKVSEKRFDIIVAIEDEDMTKLTAYNPIEVINREKLGTIWEHLDIRNIVLAYLNDKDKDHFMELCVKDLTEALQWLLKGVPR